MYIDVLEVRSRPEYVQIILTAISDGRQHIEPVQSPVQGRARSNLAFPNDKLLFPVMPQPPPPPQATNAPSPTPLPRNPVLSTPTPNPD
jgi:hypothetical protein